MTDEIEAKIPCADLTALRERLAALGAALRASGLEHNVVFDTPSGDHHASDSLLRLRSYNGAVLTWKGPRRSTGSVKTRREIEVGVADFDQAAALLEALGFAPVWTYQKRREEWTLGDAHVLLDTLPLIGDFVEVEAPDRSAVMEAVTALGLSPDDVTPLTYFELFQNYLRQRKMSNQDMVFEDKEHS